MKWLFHFILSHSIFIAFCAAALSLQTFQLLSLPFSGYLLAFIFFAALGGYNAYWMVSRFSFNGYNSVTTFFQKNRSSFLVLISAITGMIYCMANLNLVMYYIAIAFFIFCLYTLPVLPFKQLQFTKKTGFLKTIILALAWTIVTTLVPLQASILQIGDAAMMLFIHRFLFMLMLCIIFDRRDAAVDKIRGLKSLATEIKPLTLHYLIGFIFISYTCMSYFMKAYQVSIPQVAALMISGFITLFVYCCSIQKRGYFFYYFLVDGLMFLSALLTGLTAIL